MAEITVAAGTDPAPPGSSIPSSGRGRATRRWAILLVTLAVLGGVLWLGGRHVWAWYHWRAGRAALDQYHGQEALNHLGASLEVWPASAATHLLAARAARRAGEDQLAREHLQECYRLEGDVSPEAAFEDALLSAATGYLDEVEASLESAMEQDPTRAPLVWEALAVGYLRIYRIRDALITLERWLGHQPDNPQALFLQGEVWRHVHKLDKAIPGYRRVVQLDPQHPSARRWLVICLMEGGQFKEAAGHLDVLRRDHPDDPDLRVRLARCRSKMGQVDAARAILDRVLADHPDHRLGLRWRGQLALMENKPAEAERWLRRAARVSPYDYEVHYALFQALVQQGKKAQAQAQSRRAEDLKQRLERLGKIQTHDMSMRPHDPAVHCEMGTLLIGLGYPDLGCGWLHSALRQKADYAPAHAALADYYAAHGDPGQAAEHRRRAAAAAGSRPANAGSAQRRDEKAKALPAPQK